ncbi:hypothetical protein [Pseudomonas sp. TUM22785]|uniref:hypothetical protein n=1 Tax=Pseudomonas sp. TUM22785 TaxID=3019098 RepID=UPI002305D1D9|nr:hypothetical protein [Pseudomonas sp. TUM22785]WCD78299.1 hypothetical protein PI990_20100 [Pseudomonas sp. TUM22785]
MIDEAAARAIVLALDNRQVYDDPLDQFVVSSCTLSERGDCWIVQGNTRGYVEQGLIGYCRVGVNAYLVDVHSGRIDTVGSAQSLEEVLQRRRGLMQ